MATLIYGFTSLNIADGNSLKEIDGALLNDADMALGIYDSKNCLYQLSANSGATESLPDIVSPSLNAGTKRWILKGHLATDVTVNDLTASKLVFTDANKKLVSKPFATADEITTGTEPAKAIAPDQLALTKYNGDWSFWGIKNLRLIDVHSGDATRVIVNPGAYNIPILIGEHWHVMTASVDVDSVDDLDTGTLAAGTDYYIYACTDGTTLSFKVSANSTNPAGFDAAHSRKIGGFHTLCVAVGTISGHPLTGYAQKDILPASIWDLKHRAKNLVNVGLVYDSKIQKWVDIYLASGTGASTTSVNGGTISDMRNWMDFVDDGHAVGKRLPSDHEFASFAAGSNEKTNISGSSDPGTTGGHVDTAGRRMISNIGCEDCCGVVWQWIQDQSYGDIKLLAGGNWSDAANAGSRSRSTNNSRWTTYSHLGARFAVEPL